MSSTTDATCGTGTDYPSTAPRYTLVFVLLSALYYKCGLLSMAMFYRRRSQIYRMSINIIFIPIYCISLYLLVLQLVIMLVYLPILQWDQGQGQQLLVSSTTLNGEDIQVRLYMRLITFVTFRTISNRNQMFDVSSHCLFFCVRRSISLVLLICCIPVL